MRFYTSQHRYYCGIDLHARTLYLCVVDCQGKIRLHKRLRCEREALLRALEPYRSDLVVGSECIFCWYWLADLCAREQIHFVLGHALYMKAIHGAKALGPRVNSSIIYKKNREGLAQETRCRGCGPSPASAASWRSRCSMRSTTSLASARCSASAPTVDSPSPSPAVQASGSAAEEPRSATHTSSGRSVRPPSSPHISKSVGFWTSVDCS